jgi:hypothetical protein
MGSSPLEEYVLAGTLLVYDEVVKVNGTLWAVEYELLEVREFKVVGRYDDADDGPGYDDRPSDDDDDPAEEADNKLVCDDNDEAENGMLLFTATFVEKLEKSVPSL